MAGMNSIDSVRQTKAIDVLMFASEDKELSEAEYFDYKLKNPKQ